MTLSSIKIPSYYGLLVVLDGAQSDPVFVQSGVPQGTFLGPFMFLLYINDIADGLSSSLRLFADDCLLYRAINSEKDAIQLQWTNYLLGRQSGNCTFIKLM